ncbi:MAG: hypothetical protein V4813_03370 [Gemmatimonadota bacterium]
MSSVVVAGAPTAITFAGDSFALKATALSASGNAIANRPFEWTSSAPSVASVSSVGTVHLLREGVAIISATASGKSATVRVDVGIGGVIGAAGGVLRNVDSSVVITFGQNVFQVPTQVVMRLLGDSAGDSRTIPGTVFALEPDTLLIGAQVVLKLTFNPARVPAGLPTESLELHSRVGAGWAPTVSTALDNAARQVTGRVLRSGIFAVRSTRVDRIVLSGANAGGGLYSGDVATLIAELYDSTSRRLPARRMQWSSSAPNVVSADSLGRVTAADLGTATITASVDGATATTTVSSIISRPSDFSAAEEWSTYQGTFLHSGHVPATVSPGLLRELWIKTPVVGVELGQVTIGGSRLFVAAQTPEGGQRLLALNSADGAVHWSHSPGPTYSTSQPTWHAGRAYATQSGPKGTELIAFDESNGAIVYRTAFTEDNAAWKAPSIAGTTVGVAAGPGGGMYGLDIATGVTRFFRPGSANDQPWTPTVYEGRFYTSDGGVQAIHAIDGALISEIAESRLLPTTLSVANGPIVHGIANGRLFSVNLFAGTVMAVVEGGFTGMSLSTTWGIALNATRVEAYSLYGEPRLTYPMPANCAAEPRSLLATRNLLFVSCIAVDGSSGGTTEAIDLVSGLRVWSYPFGGNLSLSAQGVLYITNGAKIVAITAR